MELVETFKKKEMSNKIDSIFNLLNDNFLYTCLDHYKDHVTYELDKFVEKYKIDFEYTFLFDYFYTYSNGHTKNCEPSYVLSKKEKICANKWIQKLYNKKTPKKKAAELIIRAGMLYFNWR